MVACLTTIAQPDLVMITEKTTTMQREMIRTILPATGGSLSTTPVMEIWVPSRRPSSVPRSTIYTMQYFAASSKPETGILVMLRLTTWIKQAATITANAITMIHFSSICRNCRNFFI